MHSFHATSAHLLALFHSGEALTYRQAAARLGVGIRQVQRLIRRIKDDGVPLQAVPLHAWRTRRDAPTAAGDPHDNGQSLVWYLREQDRQTGVRITLNEAQAFALAVAAEAVRATFAPTPLGHPLREAFAHLLDGLPAEILSFETEDIPQHWHFSGASSRSFDPEIFIGISRALIDCRRIRIDYYTASKQQWSYGRAIDPYGLAVRNGTWLLIAFCREKQAMREFNLVGITRLEQTEKHFLRPEDFNIQQYFANRFNAIGGGEYTIRLLVESGQAPYFDRKIYHPSQVISKREPDGSIVVCYTVRGLDDIRAFVQSYGTGVTVLEPQELREVLRREATALAERYTDSLPSFENELSSIS